MAGAGLTEYVVATAIDDALTRTINAGVQTPDIGGDATTEEFTDAITKRL